MFFDFFFAGKEFAIQINNNKKNSFFLISFLYLIFVTILIWKKTLK